jgi:predicted secreted protein
MATELAEIAWFKRDQSKHWLADERPNGTITNGFASPAHKDVNVAEAIKNKDVQMLREILTAKGDTAWDEVW